jgi:hypothetical protein
MLESFPEMGMTLPMLVVCYMECEEEEEGGHKVETRNDEKGINCQRKDAQSRRGEPYSTINHRN